MTSPARCPITPRCPCRPGLPVRSSRRPTTSLASGGPSSTASCSTTASLAAMQDVDRSAGLPCADRLLPPVRARPAPQPSRRARGCGATTDPAAPCSHTSPTRASRSRCSRPGATPAHAILHRVMNATPGSKTSATSSPSTPTARSPRAVIATRCSTEGRRGHPTVSTSPSAASVTATPSSTSPLPTGATCGASPTIRPTTSLPGGRPTARRSSSPAGAAPTATSTSTSWTRTASDVRRVTDDPIDEELPVFSPDGRRIAFNTNCRRVDGDIVLIDADGTDRQVIADPGDDWAPTWSPDGASIAFVRGGAASG